MTTVNTGLLGNGAIAALAITGLPGLLTGLQECRLFGEPRVRLDHIVAQPVVQYFQKVLTTVLFSQKSPLGPGGVEDVLVGTTCSNGLPQKGGRELSQMAQAHPASDLGNPVGKIKLVALNGRNNSGVSRSDRCRRRARSAVVDEAGTLGKEPLVGTRFDK